MGILRSLSRSFTVYCTRRRENWAKFGFVLLHNVERTANEKLMYKICTEGVANTDEKVKDAHRFLSSSYIHSHPKYWVRSQELLHLLSRNPVDWSALNDV